MKVYGAASLFFLFFKNKVMYIGVFLGSVGEKITRGEGIPQNHW